MERKNILIGQRQRVRKQNSEELVRWQFECHLIEHLRVKYIHCLNISMQPI